MARATDRSLANDYNNNRADILHSYFSKIDVLLHTTLKYPIDDAEDHQPEKQYPSLHSDD